MRRTQVLGAASWPRWPRGAGCLGRLRLEPSRGARDPDRPDRGQHRRLRLHGEGRSGQPDRGRQLDPARGAGRRPVLRQARSEGPLLRQDRQHRRRSRGRRVPVEVQAEVPQPELVPVRGADGHVGDDPDINFVQTYDLYRETYDKNGELEAHEAVGERPASVAPDNVGPKTIPNYEPVSNGAIAPVKGGGKTFVGPVDDPFFIDLGTVFDGINIDKPGRPNIGLGNQGGGKDDVSSYNTHSFVAAGPGVAGDARRQVGHGHEGHERRRRRVGDHRAQAHVGAPPQRPQATYKPDWVQVSRLGNPLINEVVIPIGDKDKFNRTSPADDAGELRQVRPQPGAGPPAERAVRPRRQGDQPHGHRPGAPDRRARPDADRQEPGPGRHAQAQPGRAAGRDREPLRRARGRPGRLPERPPAGR